MKTTATIISTLCWTARLAAAATAHVYLHDPQSQPRGEAQSATLSPVAARLVLAQRAGVEDYHKSDLHREDVISAINDYGVRTPLFADAEGRPRKAFILVEDEKSPEKNMPSLRSYTSFEISSAPQTSASRGLFIDLAKQSDPRNLSRLSDEDVLSHLGKGNRALHTKTDMFYITQSLADFEALTEVLRETSDWAITALITPPESILKTSDSKFQWGTYEMPGKQSPLHKRQRQMKEEPLTETEEFKPVQSFSAPVSSFADNTTPLKGILPACFTSQSACESATRNCTGHGQCSKKYHDSDSLAPGGSTGLDCWSCQCKSTKSSDGKKTTVWGGPACQKKDVSVQFWLIALFTVGLIFLVSFAVGSIWEMGSEELPSVIGAGVSGPTARK